MAFDGAPAADRPAQQDAHGGGPTGPPRLRLAYGAVLLAAAIVLLAAGLAGYRLAPHGVNLVRLQWQGPRRTPSGPLGAWLPNPYFVALKLQHLDDWTIPGLPATRRLSYFAREIFGIHPGTGRLLLCTDGGHYDNLGLVELLHRRCQRIFCVDASGSVPPLDDALAGALTLAAEELGVQITLRDSAYDLVPGGWDFMQPPEVFASLNSRLSKDAVLIGDIVYPAVAGYGEARGGTRGRTGHLDP